MTLNITFYIISSDFILANLELIKFDSLTSHEITAGVKSGGIS